MSRQFTAVVLLDDECALDIDAIAAMVRQRYHQVGRVEAIPGQGQHGPSGLIRIDGGHIVITQTLRPFALEDLDPPLDVMRAWNPGRALARHTGYLTVSCGGGLPGLDGAKAYAAAVQFVAASAAAITPSVAIHWSEGFALTSPQMFEDATDALITGRIPLGCWVSFAAVVPRGHDAKDALGMLTYGMRPFLGRELELAPRPGDAKSAFHTLSTVASRVLSQGLTLADGDRLRGLDGSFDVTVRARTYWLRRSQSAYVLVADDAVVDMETLRPREPAALSA